MSGFGSWRNEQRFKLEGYTERDAYEAGAQSRQAEIDELQSMYEKQGLYAFELQKRIDELQETATGWKDECRSMTLRYERLQKRIDEALEEFDSYFGDNYPVLKAIKILKGNQNEN